MHVNEVKSMKYLIFAQKYAVQFSKKINEIFEFSRQNWNFKTLGFQYFGFKNQNIF